MPKGKRKNEEAVTDQRGSNGKFIKGNTAGFLPGQSGNPQGLPKDPGITTIRQYLNDQIDKNWEKLIAVVIQKAIGGDRDSLFYCLDKRIGRTPIQLDQRVKSIVFTADDYLALELGLSDDKEKEDNLLLDEGDTNGLDTGGALSSPSKGEGDGVDTGGLKSPQNPGDI